MPPIPKRKHAAAAPKQLNVTREEQPAPVTDTSLVRECAQCGATIIKTHPRKAYCDEQCRQAAYVERRRRNQRTARKLAKAKDPDLGVRSCRNETCGRRIKGKRSDARYCSAKCKQADYRLGLWVRNQ